MRPKDADKVDWFTADHVAAGSDDLCFLTSSPPEEVVAHLTALGINTSLALLVADGLRAYIEGRKKEAADDLGTAAEEIAARLEMGGGGRLHS